LALGADESQAGKLGELYSEWGNFDHLIVRKDGDGYRNLEGQTKIKAMINSNYNEAIATIIDIKSDKDAIIFSIKHDMAMKIRNNIVIADLVNLLVKQGLRRNDIIKETGLNKSKLSKMITLSNDLHDQIRPLVMKNDISPRTAEVVARLPQNIQLTFAKNIIEENLNKNQVEKLVSCYINKNTPESMIDEIIKNPINALNSITNIETRKTREKSKKNDLIIMLNLLRYANKNIEEMLNKCENLKNEHLEAIKEDFLILKKNCSALVDKAELFYNI
jgi:hypothetical protein